jgi:hypothetical protein
MKKLTLCFVVFFILNISAIDVNFNCPDSVQVNEEFVCSVKASNFEESYDLKFYIKGDDKGIAQIWNGTEWQTAYRYVKDFIKDKEEKQVKLKITKDFEGNASGTLRLRKFGESSGFDYEEIFSIYVGENITDEIEVIEESSKQELIKDEPEEEEDKEEDIIKEEVVQEKIIRQNETNKERENSKSEIINLNPKIIKSEDSNKNWNKSNYARNGFIVFCFLLVGLFILKKEHRKSEFN